MSIQILITGYGLTLTLALISIGPLSEAASGTSPALLCLGSSARRSCVIFFPVPT